MHKLQIGNNKKAYVVKIITADQNRITLGNVNNEEPTVSCYRDGSCLTIEDHNPGYETLLLIPLENVSSCSVYYARTNEKD